MSELGIELLKQEENTVQTRIFTRGLRNVAGCRFDPDYYKDYYNSLEQIVCSAMYKPKELREITNLIVNGNTPASNEYSDEETPYPIIKVGSYDGDFIALSKSGFTTSKKNKQAEQYDIFVLSAAHQADYVGRSLKILDDEPNKNTSFVGELICIRANREISNPMYLFSLLNTKLYKDLLNREKTGQTSHIYPKDIQHISVPVPPLNKQDEMAEHITQIRHQAKQLRQQAKAELEQAKKDAEVIHNIR